MARLLQQLKLVWARANDVCLGIETGFSAGIECQQVVGPTKYGDAAGYQAVDYWNIRRVIRMLNPTPEDVLYDIGCGKGRVLACFARHELKRVVGIDLSEALCRSARKNSERLRARKTSIEIRCEDAASADISDGTIYFMFNPFGEQTMRAVLANIEASLILNARDIRIIYVNPQLGNVLDSCAWLVRECEFKNFTGGRIVFWKGRKPVMGRAPIKDANRKSMADYEPQGSAE